MGVPLDSVDRKFFRVLPSRLPLMRQRLEYALAWLVIKTLGVLPRPLARAAAILIAWKRLRSASSPAPRRNAQFRASLPGKDTARAGQNLARRIYVSGRQLAEVCHFPKYTRENVGKVVVYDGFENFERAFARGKGVLFLTAHIGRLGTLCFMPIRCTATHAHRHAGPLDNVYLDRMVRRYRTMHGNTVVDKDDFVRGLLSAMKAGRDRRHSDGHQHDPAARRVRGFFRHTRLHRQRPGENCSAIPTPPWCPASPSGTQRLRKYRLRFEPAVNLIRSGNDEADIVANTRYLPKLLRTTSANIPTSGCGYTAAGRRGPKDSRRYIELY